MENHGPLHLEKTTLDEQKSYFKNKDTNIDENKNAKKSESKNDLTVYLRHLKNADNMLKTLTDTFKQSKKTQLLCFYGDHIPSMPNNYKQMNYDNHNSDYIIWSNQTSNNANNEQQRTKPRTKPRTMSVENLAEHLLK